jgi:hypothetical protein
VLQQIFRRALSSLHFMLGFPCFFLLQPHGCAGPCPSTGRSTGPIQRSRRPRVVVENDGGSTSHLPGRAHCGARAAILSMFHADLLIPLLGRSAGIFGRFQDALWSVGQAESPPHARPEQSTTDVDASTDRLLGHKLQGLTGRPG